MNLTQYSNTLLTFLIISLSVLSLIRFSASLTVISEPNKNSTVTSTKTFQNSSSTIITKSSLREIFDFSGHSEGIKLSQWGKDNSVDTSTPASLTHRMTSSTFRPTSSILFLTPPKPKHIASITSELNSIELDPNAGQLTLRWSVIVVLKGNTTNSTTPFKTKRSAETALEKETKKEEDVIDNDENEEEEEEVVVNLQSDPPSTTPQSLIINSTISTINSTTAVSPAKVEQARNPLKWIITLRRYGHAHRERFPIEDRVNNLDPPFTGNKSYHYRLEHLSPESSYELCIQSVNGGRLRQSEEVARLFPLNAHASGIGSGNPLFICKEVYVSPPEVKGNKSGSDLEVEMLGSERKTAKNGQIRGRGLVDGSSIDGETPPAIEVSEETTDAFVVYTAITSGSTTVLLLIVVVTFCCCRCNKKKTEHREYRQNILYNRAPAGEQAGSPYF